MMERAPGVNTPDQAKEVPADVMEGASTANNNRGFKAASEKLQQSFNPDRVRKYDSTAIFYNPTHVWAKELIAEGPDKGKETGGAKLVYMAGEYLSNIEKAYVDEQLADTEFQNKQRQAMEEAGFRWSTEEQEVEAKVLQ